VKASDLSSIDPTWATITNKYKELDILSPPDEILKKYKERLEKAQAEKAVGKITTDAIAQCMLKFQSPDRLVLLTMASVENNLGELARAIKCELKLSWPNMAQDLNIKAGALKALTSGDFCGFKTSQKDPLSILETLAMQYSEHDNKRVRLLCQKLQEQVNLTREFQENHKDCLSAR
jgi:hypothetical protein